MTLWPFQSVVVFSKPYEKAFIAPRLSSAYVLDGLLLLALIIMPVFAAFASDNFWVREGFYREQPRVIFLHDLMLLLNGVDHADPVMWSTRSEFNERYMPHIRVPLVRYSSEDHNYDGLPDKLHLTLSMPTGLATHGYQHVQFLAVFAYELQDKVRLSMSGLVALDLSTPLAASGVTVNGILELRQERALRRSSQTRTLYSASPMEVDWKSNWVARHPQVTVPDLLERYAERNETVHLTTHVPPIWNYAPSETFDLKITIQVPQQIVYYVPGALEVLKYAWMQYVSMLLPVWLIVYALKAFVYENQLVQTYVLSQLPMNFQASSDSLG